MLIGVVGDPDDVTASYVTWLAQERGLSVLPLPEAGLGETWNFSQVDLSAGGRLYIGASSVPLQDLAGVFVRFNPQPPLPGGLALDEDLRRVFMVERRDALHAFLANMNCPVVNRPWAGRSNGSKPFQMGLLEACGFKVPRWVVTNDADTARAFQDTCAEGAIYKATSGLRSRVRMMDEVLFERFRAGTTPTVLQAFIPGKDVRIHTVRRQVFAAEIVSSGVDYRFEDAGGQYNIANVPPEIASLCCSVAEREGLLLAGFDFRVTRDEEWYCLEVNPVPSFLPYEAMTGLPIGAAVLSTLIGERPYHRAFVMS